VSDPKRPADDGDELSPDVPAASQPLLSTLLAKARGGDPEAAGLLVQHYRKYLLLIANQELEPQLKTKLGASDVVQESIIHAQQNFAMFRGHSEGELLAWLRAILLNDLRKQRRHFATLKRNSKNESSLHQQSTAARQVADENLTPRSDAIQHESVQALFQALEQLSEDQRTAITLRNFDELDFAEIGRRLDRSPDAARKLWARAIESLRDILGSETPTWFPDGGDSRGSPFE
jgi:RNA polymerase sigma-70 factor (ECF subfamily)